jgi:glycosyltransferase involved in cell wall biosynthesis
MRKVFLEPLWKLPQIYGELLRHPPDGYSFFCREGGDASAARIAHKLGLPRAIWSGLARRGFPLSLAKSYVDRFRRPPPDTDLTWAVAHLIFRKELWILDLPAELPTVLIGHDWHFRPYRRLVAQILLTQTCRKIITSVSVGKKALVDSLGVPHLEEKVEVVYPAVSRKGFTKHYEGDSCRILFVNSSNLPRQFHMKGGKEALEAFLVLKQRYRDVQLVMRSDVPDDIRARYRGIQGLKVIDRVMPWSELEQEFQHADIFLLPSHITPHAVFVDAMSYELPIVTTDVWGNSELVTDGQTGFLVPKSRVADDFAQGIPWGRTRAFEEVVRRVDPAMVENLVRKLAWLIENPAMRRRMGKEGRHEVEQGRFSITMRNYRLRRILDEATSPLEHNSARSNLRRSES